MWTIRLLRILVLVAAVLPTRVVGEETPPPPDPPATQETQVKGTPPPLMGRWLVLTNLVNPGGALMRVNASVWEMLRKDDGSLDLREGFVLLPQAQQDDLDAANAATKPWEPTPADLDAILAAWDRLVPTPRGVAQMTHEIIAADAFDDDLKREELTKGARFVVRQVYLFAPGPSRPVNQVNLLAVESEQDGVFAGRHATVTVAAAPFPIPIKLAGTFRLIPLATRSPSVSPSFWTRIADVFRGCN